MRYRLTASENLAAKLELFLIFCRVENLSQATISDYSFKIGRFIQFCQKARIHKPQNVSRSIINLFFMNLKQRQKPYSILGYHKSIKRFFNWLVEQECLEANPMGRINRVRPNFSHCLIHCLLYGQCPYRLVKRVTFI